MKRHLLDTALIAIPMLIVVAGIAISWLVVELATR
jgi:hypothetical protein